MKSLLSVLLLSVLAASAQAKQVDSDRVLVGEERGRKIYGIKHSENFELVCDVSSTENGEWKDFKLWIDRDFNLKPGEGAQTKNFRIALALPNKQRVGGFVGFEMPIVSASVGRCLELCLLIQTVTVEDDVDVKRTYSVKEVGPDSYTVLGVTDTGLEDVKGTCKANEVP